MPRRGLAVRRRARKAYTKVAKKSKPGTGKRFAALEKSVAASLKPSAIRKGQTRQQAAAGIAAASGRRKFGKKRMAKMAAAGRRRKK